MAKTVKAAVAIVFDKPLSAEEVPIRHVGPDQGFDEGQSPRLLLYRQSPEAGHPMTSLVTGAAGQLGAALVRKLLADGEKRQEELPPDVNDAVQDVLADSPRTRPAQLEKFMKVLNAAIKDLGGGKAEERYILLALNPGPVMTVCAQENRTLATRWSSPARKRWPSPSRRSASRARINVFVSINNQQTRNKPN